MIQDLLYKYLILNGRLGIPEIGRFAIYRAPASVQEDGTVMRAPVQQILFEEKPVTADKNLFQFLAHEMSTDEIAAIGSFNTWVSSIREQLTRDAFVKLPFIGTLEQTTEGVIGFIPATPAIKPSSIDLPYGIVWQTDEIAEDASVDKNDSGWWIYAIILLLLGIAAIAYRYL